MPCFHTPLLLLLLLLLCSRLQDMSYTLAALCGTKAVPDILYTGHDTEHTAVGFIPGQVGVWGLAIALLCACLSFSLPVRHLHDNTAQHPPSVSLLPLPSPLHSLPCRSCGLW